MYYLSLIRVARDPTFQQLKSSQNHNTVFYGCTDCNLIRYPPHGCADAAASVIPVLYRKTQARSYRPRQVPRQVVKWSSGGIKFPDGSSSDPTFKKHQNT